MIIERGLVYCCEYYIVWTPKYRFRVLDGKIKTFVEQKINQISEWYGVEVMEMNVMVDHIHVLVSIPPKLSVSEYMGILKGKTAIKLFEKKRYLREKPYWGNHFWARGYFVSTVGLDKEKIRRYIKYQEEEEKKQESEDKNYKLF
ncbi:MAG TPA: IS200/IS605 family transposase [Bacteroidia bacterium]|nr:IS200/IS605 family transposase [Bacteroidia bacterium]